MAGYLKTKVALTTGAALFGALALSGTAHAADVSVTAVYAGVSSAQALSFGANGAVRVCDIHADGHGVATYYYRANGASGRLADSNGNGTCTETSDIQSNPIVSFNACVNVSGTDHCTAYVSTGR